MKKPRNRPTPKAARTREVAQLRVQLAETQARLAEAEETLEAIRSGSVDALVVSGAEGAQVFTLKGAETPYRLLVEAMHESALLLDSDRLIIYCNSRLSALAQCAPGSLVGKPLFDFIAAEEAPELERLLTNLPLEGRTAELWLRPQNPLARPVPVQLAARPLNLDGLTGTVVIATDLTSQKAYEARLHEANHALEERVRQRTAELTRAGDQLRESEERLRFVVQNSPDNIFIQDSELRYVWVAKPAGPLTREEYIGKTDFDMGSPEDAQKLTFLKREVIQTGRPVAVELPLV